MKGVKQEILFIFLLLLSLDLSFATIEKDAQNNPVDESDVKKSEMLSDSTKTTEVPVEKSNKCFHADIEKFCFKQDEKLTSECFESPLDQNAIICCNVTQFSNTTITNSMTNKNLSAYDKIHIINASQKELDIGVLNSNSLKMMQSVAITDGNISKITGQVARMSSVLCLNISNNNITEISDRALSNLNLDILDLSSNNLTKLPSTTSKSGKINIDIRNNLKIACVSVSSALDRGIDFLHKNVSRCAVPYGYSWFNDTTTISLSNYENLRNITNCPKKCNCTGDALIFPGNEQGTAVGMVKVDCSNQQLTKLPEKLPENSYQLIISNNSITSLAPVTNNVYYSNIRALYADDNKIKNLEDLVGKKNLTKISLRNNKIRFIPNYILSNLDIYNGVAIYLGGNMLQCDCNTAKQNILRHVLDFDKILCENTESKVSDLKESILCNSGQPDWSSFINYVIVIEIFLLVGLVTKVSYDWYVFKNSGFLPVPASWIIYRGSSSSSH